MLYSICSETQHNKNEHADGIKKTSHQRLAKWNNSTILSMSNNPEHSHIEEFVRHLRRSFWRKEPIIKSHHVKHSMKYGCWALREKWPNKEFFLVRIFPYSNRIRRDTPYLSGFSPNAGKHGSEKSLYLDNFYAVGVLNTSLPSLYLEISQNQPDCLKSSAFLKRC